MAMNIITNTLSFVFVAVAVMFVAVVGYAVYRVIRDDMRNNR